MLPKWLMALLVLLQEAWSTRRDAHIRFLKLQVEMLKARLPGNRVILDPVERRQLMKIGAEVDHRVEDTLGIVSIKTYRRWQREERAGREQPGERTFRGHCTPKTCRSPRHRASIMLADLWDRDGILQKGRRRPWG